MSLLSHLIILGDEFGEFLMPPLRCFFFGDNANCWSSSTATKRQQYEGVKYGKTQ